MSLIARFTSWLRATLGRSRMEQDLDREVRFHIDQYADDLVSTGVPPPEAHRRARAEFGAVEARKEECRQALGLRIIDELTGDFRYALRQLRRSPAFAAVAILSLALGIGANTAILSLMETALWKPLPVNKPQELRLLSWTSGPKLAMNGINGNMDETSTGGRESTSFSYPVFRALERESHTLQDLFAFKPLRQVTAVINGEPELLYGELVSGGFYAGLGVRPSIGRAISAADDVPEAETVGVLSDGFWTRRFGRALSIVGSRIEINHVPVTVVGVNPPDFSGLEPGQDPDVFLPISHQPAFLVRPARIPWVNNPDVWWLLVMGRLAPEASEANAQAELDLVLQQTVRATLPQRAARDQPHLRMSSGARGLDNLESGYRTPLFFLLALAGLILLMTCANVANLLLARAARRQREVSLRLALGAGRRRILRQLLTEGLTLAAIGGTGGVMLGYWLRDAIPSLLATSWQPSPLEATFDTRVVALAAGLTLATGVLFSLAGAWRSSLVEIGVTLKDADRSVLPLPRWTRGKPLVVLQIGISLVLLIGAGLFIRTLVNLESAALGFTPDRVLLFSIDPSNIPDPARRKATLEQIEEGVELIPGVEAASLSADPLVGRSSSTTMVTMLEEGGTSSPNSSPKQGPGSAWVNDISDGFFETMGIPILAGRTLQRSDREGAQRVAVVSQQFARRFFANQDPLGKQFKNGDRTLEVIGVVGDTRYDRVQRPFPPTFFRAYRQEAAEDLSAMTFEVRTAAPGAVLSKIREVVRSVDASLAVFDVRSQREQIAATTSQERLFVALTTTFGALALTLACLGIYGIMANSVARRTKEFGVRIALGASHRDVVSMILRDTLVLAVMGIGVGAAAAAGLARYVRAMLYGVEPIDPVAVATATALLLGVALLAAWIPARRASRLEPVAALRHD